MNGRIWLTPRSVSPRIVGMLSTQLAECFAGCIASKICCLQITPSSSIHILAKSDENVPANAQNPMPNDWVDLKEKTESKSKPILKEKQKPSSRQTDVVQHEVAALKLAQGLLKGMYLLNVVDLTACYEKSACHQQRKCHTGTAWQPCLQCCVCSQLYIYCIRLCSACCSLMA